MITELASVRLLQSLGGSRGTFNPYSRSGDMVMLGLILRAGSGRQHAASEPSLSRHIFKGIHLCVTIHVPMLHSPYETLLADSKHGDESSRKPKSSGYSLWDYIHAPET